MYIITNTVYISHLLKREEIIIFVSRAYKHAFPVYFLPILKNKMVQNRLQVCTEAYIIIIFNTFHNDSLAHIHLRGWVGGGGVSTWKWVRVCHSGHSKCGPIDILPLMKYHIYTYNVKCWLIFIHTCKILFKKETFSQRKGSLGKYLTWPPIFILKR